MRPQKLEDMDVTFKEYEVGLERHVRCIWALHMYRHHVLRANLPDSLILKINKINESMGIEVKAIDLNEYKGTFRSSVDLNTSIAENEYPKWIWFYGIVALKDSNFSGWLRSRLTARTIENLRVIFVAESRNDYHDIFCDSREPFYKSTMLLRAEIGD
ncbi:hypothetical protein [Vibrio diabolicus]|uniref:hypothetical protein n=1 Tax=Vibrio diabolicus TaxID=50719 RepID=UPI00215EC955|nr:hypothetical protein [Vibrio diabolicus]MCS0429542.1 hypothetical protein [Vibrio diabolicus]